MNDANPEIGSNGSRRPGLWRQIYVSFVVSLMSLSDGMIQGWTSPVTLTLMSPESPVGQMTKTEIATLTTAPMFASLVYKIFMNYIANRYGRKPSVMLTGAPMILSCIILTFGTNKVTLYAGRILSAMGINGVVLSMMYVSEATHESIRGRLMAMCTMQINVGILVAYGLGAVVSYKLFNALGIIIPIVFTILAFWLPETPYYLLDIEKRDKALESLTWLRGGDAEVAKQELEKMSTTKEKPPSFLQSLRVKSNWKVLGIGTMGYVLQTLSGIHIILAYTGLIFQEAGSPLSPNVSATMVASSNLIASILNLPLIDRLGRKPLLYISFVGGSLSLTVLSVFLFADQHSVDVTQFRWIPLASVVAFVFLYGVGLASIPGVVANEISVTLLRPAMSTLNSMAAITCFYTINMTFPYIDDGLGLYFCFLIPAVCNFLGIFFTYFWIPETKGKMLSDISDNFH